MYGKTGLAFDPDKRELFDSRVRKRLEETGVGASAYVRMLASGASDSEFRPLVDLLTVNEAHFFREPSQLTVFATTVLPDIYEEKQRSAWPKIRICSAGYSVGCEPYTLAIIVLEFLKQRAKVPVEIVGTDISLSALEVARKALYADHGDGCGEPITP